MFALKELSHFKNIIKKKISLFPVIFSLYYLLYFLYKISNKFYGWNYLKINYISWKNTNIIVI